MVPHRDGMICPHCGAIYNWGYGLLMLEEAEAEASARYGESRPGSLWAKNGHTLAPALDDCAGSAGGDTANPPKNAE